MGTGCPRGRGVEQSGPETHQSLRLWGNVEPWEVGESFEKVPGSRQPLRLHLERPISQRAHGKIYIKVDVFSNGFLLGSLFSL